MTKVLNLLNQVALAHPAFECTSLTPVNIRGTFTSNIERKYPFFCIME